MKAEFKGEIYDYREVSQANFFSKRLLLQSDVVLFQINLFGYIGSPGGMALAGHESEIRWIRTSRMPIERLIDKTCGFGAAGKEGK